MEDINLLDEFVFQSKKRLNIKHEDNTKNIQKKNNNAKKKVSIINERAKILNIETNNKFNKIKTARKAKSPRGIKINNISPKKFNFKDKISQTEIKNNNNNGDDNDEDDNESGDDNVDGYDDFALIMDDPEKKSLREKLAALEKNLLDNKKLEISEQNAAGDKEEIKKKMQEQEEENRKFREYREQQLKQSEEMELKLRKLEEYFDNFDS